MDKIGTTINDKYKKIAAYIRGKTIGPSESVLQLPYTQSQKVSYRVCVHGKLAERKPSYGYSETVVTYC